MERGKVQHGAVGGGFPRASFVARSSNRGTGQSKINMETSERERGEEG